MPTTKANPPKAIYYVSHSQFSIARNYGGLTFNGSKYIYDPRFDALIRADVLKKVKSKIQAAQDLEDLTDALEGVE